MAEKKQDQVPQPEPIVAPRDMATGEPDEGFNTQPVPAEGRADEVQGKPVYIVNGIRVDPNGQPV